LAELQRQRPQVKVIITSAYGQNKVRNSLDGLEPSGYVQKPYQLGELVNLLRDSSAEATSIEDLAG
jgi:DNA-binding NarL/FixJ family response regulator